MNGLFHHVCDNIICCCLICTGAMEGGRSNASEVAVTPTVASTADLSHVLSGLQQSGELSSVLQQQPQLVEGVCV